MARWSVKYGLALLFIVKGVMLFAQQDSVSTQETETVPDVSLPDSSNLSIKDSLLVTDSIGMVEQFINEDTSEVKIRDIEIQFINKKTEQSADSIYFNVCKITNTTDKEISGKFRVHVPGKWRLIADLSMQMTLAPGETLNIPVRISIPRDAVGGMAYVIDASFETNEGYYSGTAYIKIPLKVKWDMYLSANTLYFNEYFETVNFDVYISNKGNAPELINLLFKVGKLLDVVEVNENKSDYFVKIPPKTDTVFTFTVIRSQLNEDKRNFYKRIWDESTIEIKALSGNDNKTIRQSLWVRDLDNEYVHTRQEKNSPLNLDATFFNLLSPNRPRLNTMAYGEILFKGPHDLNYVFQARNLLYPQSNSLSYFENPYNYTFRINYNLKDRVHAELGEVFNTTMHAIRGWGVKGRYNITPKDEIRASYIIGRFHQMWSSSVMYTKQFKTLRAWAGATYQDDSFFGYRSLSPEVGAYFSPYKNHNIRVGIMGSNMRFRPLPGNAIIADTTVMGFSYTLNYSGIWNKFRFGLNTRNDLFNYIRVRPSNNAYGYMRYVINQKSRINFIANYNTVNTSGNVYSTYYNGSYNSQSIVRLTYLNRVKSNVVIEGGPMFRSINRLLIQNDSTASDFTNYFGGLFLISRVKLDEFQMITPSLSAGYTYFRNHLTPEIILKEQPTLNLGLSYINRNVGANANYIYGPNFFIGEGYFDNETPIAYETVQARIHHTKKFYSRNIEWRNYATYFLRLPSNRQNFVFSTALEFKLPNRWSANMLANLFTNSIDEETMGVITHRNFSMNIGIRKSFDIPQPRIKYYDVTVICFNDMNGNGVREKDEPLLSNIKMLISRDVNENQQVVIRFGEQELVTDTKGQITITDIPGGSYTAVFEPLFNLGNLYNAKGDEQQIEIVADMDYYVPYVESYQVNGQVRLIRDEFSDRGLIEVNGVRVEATNEQGETFSALTDKDGYYTLNVPRSGYFTVKVTNVFGEGFEIDKDKFLIQFDGFRHYTVDFTFYEGKKTVNFGNGEQLFNFKSITTSNQPGASDSVPESKADTIPVSPKDTIQNSKKTPFKPENKDDSSKDSGENIQLQVSPDIMQPKADLIKDLQNISEANKKLLPKNVKNENYSYLLELGIVNGKITKAQIEYLKKQRITATPIEINGITIYASEVLPNKEEAKKVQAVINSAGFTESVVVAIYKGKIIILEE